MPKDNTQELFYLVDESDQVLDSITRGEAHQDRTKIHRAVGIILLNPDGELLLQKRSNSKDMHPGKWSEAVGGHVTFGDSYEQTATKELQEELGLTAHLELLGTYLLMEPDEQEYVALFTGMVEDLPTQFDPDEVAEVKWASREELQTLADQNQLTPMSIQLFTLTGYLTPSH